jgi:hypothetical protein
MAKEYIEREAVRIAYDRSYKANTHNLYVAKAVHAQEHRRILHLLDKIPAADVVERKRGRWKFHKDGSGTCDQCHFTQKHIWDDDGWQNYCGVCGADMRERRDNNAK